MVIVILMLVELYLSGSIYGSSNASSVHLLILAKIVVIRTQQDFPKWPQALFTRGYHEPARLLLPSTI